MKLRLRFMTKLGGLVTALEKGHEAINQIYGAGAVEGYSSEYLAKKGSVAHDLRGLDFLMRAEARNQTP